MLLRLCYVTTTAAIQWIPDGSRVGGHFSGGFEDILNPYVETLSQLSSNISVETALSLDFADGCFGR